jgi:hypothetical protein
VLLARQQGVATLRRDHRWCRFVDCFVVQLHQSRGGCAGGWEGVITPDLEKRQGLEPVTIDRGPVGAVGEAGRDRFKIKGYPRPKARRRRHGKFAGIGIVGEARYYELEDWYRMLDVNLRGTPRNGATEGGRTTASSSGQTRPSKEGPRRMPPTTSPITGGCPT